MIVEINYSLDFAHIYFGKEHMKLTNYADADKIASALLKMFKEKITINKKMDLK